MRRGAGGGGVTGRGDRVSLAGGEGWVQVAAIVTQHCIPRRAQKDRDYVMDTLPLG